MSDIRKTLTKLDEMTAGATGSGSVASSMGGGNGFKNGGPGTVKRLEEIDWIPTEKDRRAQTETSKKKKEDAKLGTPSAFGMWSNNPKKSASQTKVKSLSKTFESKIDEAELDEEKLDAKDKKPKRDMIGKKKSDKRDLSKKPKNKDILPKLTEDVQAAESVLRDVRQITSGIKRGADPMEIIAQVQSMAEQHGINVKYEIGQVHEAFQALQAAVYGLEEPFEDAAYQARNQEEELDESPDGVGQNTHMFWEDKPETEREWMARMKEEHGNVKVVKDKRTGILHATVKGKEVGKYDGNQMDMFGEGKKAK